MVKEPGEYRWSSYRINGLGSNSDLCTPHDEYLSLGTESKSRCENYRALFLQETDSSVLQEIRNGTNKGMVIGNDRFRDEIEALTGRRVREKKRGRPVGWRKIKK